jgi:hypothetical protein
MGFRFVGFQLGLLDRRGAGQELAQLVLAFGILAQAATLW